MSTFGGVLSSAFATGRFFSLSLVYFPLSKIVFYRLCFATAREGHMVDVLSYIHVDSRIPSPALIFTVISVSIYFKLEN